MADKLTDIEKIEKEILQTENVEEILKYAAKNELYNIKAFQEKVKETRDTKLIYLFARDVKGADVQDLEALIFELCKNSKNLLDKYTCFNNLIAFGQAVKGANVTKIMEFILDHKFTSGYRYIKDFKGADLKRIEESLLTNSNDIVELLGFAISVNSADFEKLLAKAISINKMITFAYFEDLFEKQVVNKFADKDNLDIEKMKLVAEKFEGEQKEKLLMLINRWEQMLQDKADKNNNNVDEPHSV